jgi:uncharacterized protein (DUF488 family)
VKIFTIGFTKKSAEKFFGLLSDAGVKKILDVRLNNTSQLAGFAKSRDLEFLAKQICSANYKHLPELAPTQDILDDYKKNKGSWADYEEKFLALMRKREIEKKIKKGEVHNACLLCSEHQPHHCHRRLVVEYLATKWGNLDIVHLE